MIEILKIAAIALLFYLLGMLHNKSKHEKKIKSLELANRILREALESERKKVETLSDFRKMGRSPYVQN